MTTEIRSDPREGEVFQQRYRLDRVLGKGGFGVLYNLAWLVDTLYLALAAFYLLVLIPVMLLFKIPVSKSFTAVKEPAVIAFSTTSSERSG